jgi:hypothetical protein
MAFTRSYPRTTDTLDLSARLASPKCNHSARHVLNLSAGGMLVSGGDLPVGQTVRFELDGPHFRSAGVAKVTHHEPDATGLRFVGVDMPSESDLQEVVAGRVRDALLEECAQTAPGAYLG